MFKEFRITNYKSINQEQIFTMEACPRNEVSEHEDHVVEINGQRILKVASLYGPNGGGKTNLLTAILLFKGLVFGNKPQIYNTDNNSYINSVYADDNVTKFEMFVVNQSFEIGYSLYVDLNSQIDDTEPTYMPLRKIIKPIIKYEELIYRVKDTDEFITLYTRDESGKISSDILNDLEIIKNNSKLSEQKTFLIYLVEAFSNNGSSMSILGPVFSFYNELLNISAVGRDPSLMIYNASTKNKIEPNLPRIVKTLNKVGINIKKLFFKQLYIDNSYVLYAERDDTNGGSKYMPISSESRGTNKLVDLLISLYDQTDHRPSVFLIDDFDAGLHPKLVNAILELFTSKHNKLHQLIFNSHDMVNMNNKVFRRDEIWFAYKNEDNSTIYLPLSNIRNYKGEMVRKDAKYGKQYLEGRYGADPFVEKGLHWEDRFWWGNH